MTTQAPTGTSDVKAGIYKGRVILGEEQYGESKNGTPELLLVLNVPALGRQLTTPLYFSADAAPHSFARLRSCGWTGTTLDDLTGADTNEVDVSITYDTYDGKPQMKVQIMGGGRFNTANPVDKKTFAAKVAAISGTQAPTGGGNGSGGGAPPPPF